MDKVDAHLHVFAKLSQEFPRQTGSLAPAEREATIEELMDCMAEAGIDRAVLIDMGGPKLEQHAYVTHCVRRWPGRFVATGLVDLADPDPPARLRELVQQTGIRGIRLGHLGDPAARAAADLDAYGLFRVAEELCLNINVYTGIGQVPCIGLLTQDFPRVVVSLDHLGISPSTPSTVDRWGRPWFGDEPVPPPSHAAVLELARYPNVHVKVSGEYAFSKEPYPYRDLRPVVEDLYRAFGPRRLMWCTDFPWIVEEPGYAKLAQMIDHHLPGLPAPERELIMGGNALRVWWGEGT
ncbi:MAG: amidohydrolase family protein [Candidatus Latescibacterota bacterium]